MGTAMTLHACLEFYQQLLNQCDGDDAFHRLLMNTSRPTDQGLVLDMLQLLANMEVSCNEEGSEEVFQFVRTSATALGILLEPFLGSCARLSSSHPFEFSASATTCSSGELA